MYPASEKYRLTMKIADAKVCLVHHIAFTSSENVRIWSKITTAIQTIRYVLNSSEYRNGAYLCMPRLYIDLRSCVNQRQSRYS